jgi:type IV secretory pathway component VirB8
MFFRQPATQPAPAESLAAVQAAFEAQLPDAAFARARNEYMDSVGRAVVDRARLFIAASGFLLLALLLAAMLIMVLPLKTTEPYVLAIDATRGFVGPAAASVQRAASYTPERPVLERELFQFVERLFAINADYPRVVQDGHVAAYAYTRGRAITEFRSFMDQEQTYQRQKATPGLIRTVERKTISFREDGGLVLIRFRASERTRDRPVPLLRDFLMTLQFVREQPRERSELDSNPLGVYLTHFEIVEER